ncbi:DEKNAAC101773 [Brettanomyces naardenensis]|uniref:Adenosine kinase n=1 Tax=Brettanomyces naardenensis TaxID=13370 RepID=A0A448YIZ5_BRENA|nr:DEKNAAC101773 [Brettanomyces naardenensis]
MAYDLVCLGNPLLDIQVDVSKEFLDKYDLKANDAILAEEKHMPIYNEILAMDDVKLVAGGAAQNTARGAQYVLPPKSVLYFGSVGKDVYADKLSEANKSVGLTTSYMYQDDFATGKCGALIYKTNRSLVTDLAAANHFKPSHLEKPENWVYVESAKVFYIGGFHLTVSPDAIELLGKHAAANNKLLILNFSAPFIPEFFKDALDRVIKYVDIVVCNESEIASYGKSHGLGSENLDAIAKSIVSLPKVNEKRERLVCFTQGTEPTHLVSKDDVKVYNISKLAADKVTDTNGAGDAFAAGFVSGIVEGKDLEKSIDIGHWLAKLSIQEVGPSYPSPKRTYPN